MLKGNSQAWQHGRMMTWRFMSLKGNNWMDLGRAEKAESEWLNLIKSMTFSATLVKHFGEKFLFLSGFFQDD